jgi:hypothetical protein
MISSSYFGRLEQRGIGARPDDGSTYRSTSSQLAPVAGFSVELMPVEHHSAVHVATGRG